MDVVRTIEEKLDSIAITVDALTVVMETLHMRIVKLEEKEKNKKEIGK